MTTASVDPEALRAAAQRLEAAADSLLAAASIPLRFDSASAGRAHAAVGGAVRAAVDGVVDDARRWAASMREVAAALRTGADRWLAVESDATAALL